jgi:hypothetical protein
MSINRLKLVGLLATVIPLALPIANASASKSAAPSHLARAATARSFFNLPYDGTDPISTGCANSGVTVNNTPVNHAGRYFGNLALRWSSSCKTNWAKFSSNGNVGNVSVWVVRQADNKFCGDQSGTGCNAVWWPNSAYSNQLYGCNYATYAEVEVYNNGNPFYAFTPAVGGC